MRACKYVFLCAHASAFTCVKPHRQITIPPHYLYSPTYKSNSKNTFRQIHQMSPLLPVQSNRKCIRKSWTVDMTPTTVWGYLTHWHSQQWLHVDDLCNVASLRAHPQDVYFSCSIWLARLLATFTRSSRTLAWLCHLGNKPKCALDEKHDNMRKKR